MVDSKTDFFKVVNNFSQIEAITSVPIIRSSLNLPLQVSVVIPAYKRTNLLKEAIDSVLNQEYDLNFELIVVDDDPTRNCETEILLRSITDKRLSYYKNSQNMGTANNMNRCFELANSDWVVILNDDDLLLSTFLKDCMKLVKQQPNITVLKPSWYHWVDDGNKPVVPFTATSNTLTRVYELSQVMADTIGAPTGILINKENFILLGGFNQNFFPTFDKCFITLASYYFEVYKWDKMLSVYRWLSNDSLRVEILKGFFTNDFYLFRSILKRFKFPTLLADNFLNYKFRNMTGYYQSINPDFDFDKKTLGLKDIKRVPGRLSYIMADKLVSAFIRFYKAFGDLIFKQRQSRIQRSKEVSSA